jgi:hypothetical protein
LPDGADLPVQIQETVGQAFGQVLSQQGFECGVWAFGLPLQDGLVQLDLPGIKRGLLGLGGAARLPLDVL